MHISTNLLRWLETWPSYGREPSESIRNLHISGWALGLSDYVSVLRACAVRFHVPMLSIV
jgi:hypothetical protein